MTARPDENKFGPNVNMIKTLDSEKLGAVCDEVWRDRFSVLEGRGFLSVEAALARAVYWRLCKSNVARIGSTENTGALQTFSNYHLAVNCLLELNARPPFDSAPFLEDLIQRCQSEEPAQLGKQGEQN